MPAFGLLWDCPSVGKLVQSDPTPVAQGEWERKPGTPRVPPPARVPPRAMAPPPTRVRLHAAPPPRPPATPLPIPQTPSVSCGEPCRDGLVALQ